MSKDDALSAIKTLKAWNRKHRKNYVPINPTVLSPIFDQIPNNENGDEVVPDWLDLWFCPKCGCTQIRSTGNMATYPECWEKCFCSNCGFLVGLVDNSPPLHWSEWKFNDWNIDL